MTNQKTDREIAEAATKGPWGYEQSGYCCSAVYKVSPQYTTSGAMSLANAQFIAHFDPVRVGELLDTIEAQEGAIEWQRQEMDKLRHERDQYDARRREAMANYERLRDEFYALKERINAS